MPRILITEPDHTPQPYRFAVDRIVTKIGRGTDNDIILATGSASTYHCKMKRVEGGFILADNNSTNGIKHEETQYSIIDLVDGITIQIGDDIDLKFTLTEEEIAQLSQEDFEPQQKASFPKSNTPVEESYEDLPEEPSEKVVLEEAPKKRKRRPSKDSPEPEYRDNEDNNIPTAKIVTFILLAILCFVIGLAIKHYQDNGTFIFS